MSLPRSPRAVTLPCGTCHKTSPVLRSYAVSCDHGGPMIDRPPTPSGVVPVVRKSYGALYSTKPSGRYARGAGVDGAAGPASPRPRPPAAPRPPAPPRPRLAPGSMILSNVGSSFETMYIVPFAGSTAELPQLAPPL